MLLMLLQFAVLSRGIVVIERQFENMADMFVAEEVLNGGITANAAQAPKVLLNV